MGSVTIVGSWEAAVRASQGRRPVAAGVPWSCPLINVSNFWPRLEMAPIFPDAPLMHTKTHSRGFVCLLKFPTLSLGAEGGYRRKGSDNREVREI